MSIISATDWLRAVAAGVEKGGPKNKKQRSNLVAGLRNVADAVDASMRLSVAAISKIRYGESGGASLKYKVTPLKVSKKKARRKK